MSVIGHPLYSVGGTHTMNMTFPQYIQNPMGIANAVISSREMYRTMYTEKWNKIMLRENGKIDYQLYKKKNSYIVYIKIPSEVVPNFYYDTVIEFNPPEKTSTVLPTLEKYNVKFYSNDPSFVYTYAHAFIRNNIFIEDLKPKMAKLAVKKNADKKNPTNMVGYVKSLYFAWLVIKSKGLLSKTHYITASEYNAKSFMKNIMNAEEKVAEREKAAETIEKKRRKEASVTGNTQRAQNQSTKKSNVRKSNVIGSSKTTNVIKPKGYKKKNK